MLGFDRHAFMYTVRLPVLPREGRVFQASEIPVEAIPTTWALSGGSVRIDPAGRQVAVDLQVDGKPFQGNGDFPLSVADRACPAGQ